MANDEIVVPNPWQALKQYTSARIALGRVGNSLPAQRMLEFQLAHAQARDAVHLPFDRQGLRQELEAEGFAVLDVHSAAANRTSYLQRPDLGRRLNYESQTLLQHYRSTQPESSGYDAAFVIADGLSALAVHSHAIATLRLAHHALQQAGWRIAPIILAEQSRVALGDEIGALVGAQQIAMLIGERPGLSAADSLGIYLTYQPRPGRTDAERNCLSNIRPEGLSYQQAAHKLVFLMREARRLQLTGVELKDESDSIPLLVG